MSCSISKALLTGALLLITLSIAARAQGRFVYTNNDIFGANQNSVSGFNAGPDGKLKLMSDAPYSTGDGGGDPLTSDSVRKIVVSQRGPFLFAANEGGGNISVFNIHFFSGELTAVEGSPFDSHDANDDKGLSLALTRDEMYLYAANYGDQTISVFSIADDGKLTMVPGAPYGVPGRPHQIVVSPDGKYMTVILDQEFGEKIGVYLINPGGGLTPAVGSPFAHEAAGFPTDIVINCQSNLLFLAVSKDLDPVIIEVFNIGAGGSLTPVAESPFVFDMGNLVSSGYLALSPDGRFLFANGNNGGLSIFKIAPGGGLTPTPASPHLGYAGGRMETNSQGTVLYLATSPQSVAAFTIGVDGSLTEIEGSPYATGENNGPQVDEGFLHSLAVYPPAGKCSILPADVGVVSTAKGECGAVVNYPLPQTCGTDCGAVICNPPAGSHFPVGTTVVTCTAAGGGFAQFEVKVEDHEPPDVTAPQVISVPTDPGKCSAVVNFDVSSTDNCPGVSVVANPPSGSVFPKGATPVTVTAKDNSGNEKQKIFVVQVDDDEKPQIDCPADIMTTNAPGQCGALVNYKLPSVSDNCAVGNPMCNPAPGSFFPVGPTVVMCTVSDSESNNASCSFKVVVADVEAPEITCPADMTVVAAAPCQAGAVVNYPAPAVDDNCDNLSVVCTPASGSVLPVGTTTVSCEVTDGGGNTDACTFKITVFDVRLQDDTNPAKVILINSFTGEYRFCAPGVDGNTFVGTGTITKKGCDVTLHHNTADRRVSAQFTAAIKKGTASLQSPPGVVASLITDKNTADDTSICP